MAAPISVSPSRAARIRRRAFIGIRQDERLIRFAAAQRDGEQQVVVVDAAVACVVEEGEVLDQLDASLLEYAAAQ